MHVGEGVGVGGEVGEEVAGGVRRQSGERIDGVARQRGGGCEAGVGEHECHGAAVDDEVDQCGGCTRCAGVGVEVGVGAPKHVDEGVVAALGAGAGERLAGGVVAVFGAAGGSVGAEFVLAEPAEDRLEFVVDERVAAVRVEVEFAADGRDVHVASGDLGVARRDARRRCRRASRSAAARSRSRRSSSARRARAASPRTRPSGHAPAGCGARGRSLLPGRHRCVRSGAPRPDRGRRWPLVRAGARRRCRGSTSYTSHAGSPSSCGARRPGTGVAVRRWPTSMPSRRRRGGAATRGHGPARRARHRWRRATRRRRRRPCGRSARSCRTTPRDPYDHHDQGVSRSCARNHTAGRQGSITTQPRRWSSAASCSSENFSNCACERSR